MSVYVDQPRYQLGRMIMCHMLADTHAELIAMVDAIGVPRKWIQNKGMPNEHFDICKSKREWAVNHGAKEVNSREFIEIIRRKRADAGGGQG